FKLVGIYRENTGKYHWFYFFKTLYHLRIGVRSSSDRITYFYLFSILYTCDDITNVATIHFRLFCHLQFQYTYFICIIFLASRNEMNFITFLNRTIQYTIVNDDAAKRIKNTIKDESLQRRCRISFGRGYLFYDCFQYGIYTYAGSTACE